MKKEIIFTVPVWFYWGILSPNNTTPEQKILIKNFTDRVEKEHGKGHFDGIGDFLETSMSNVNDVTGETDGRIEVTDISYTLQKPFNPYLNGKYEDVTAEADRIKTIIENNFKEGYRESDIARLLSDFYMYMEHGIFPTPAMMQFIKSMREKK